MNKQKITSTQFEGLGFGRIAPSTWRVFDIHEGKKGANAVGPFYGSKDELLADLPRHAKDSWDY